MECGLYFVLVGLFHLAIFLVGGLAFAPIAIRQRDVFLRRVGRLGLFLGLALIVGSVANGVWSCAIWGRLYVSTDYVFDFTPFWPITQKVIDAPFANLRGQLLGVSLLQLQLVWFLFAACTWTVCIFLYRWILRRPCSLMAWLSPRIVTPDDHQR